MTSTYSPSFAATTHRQTIRRFGSSGVNYRSREPIALDDLRKIAPSVFDPMQSRIEFPHAARITDAVHVMQVPVISTRHITAADGARLALNDPRDSLAVVEGGRGHIITWDDVKPGHIDGPQDFADDFPPDLFSPEFRALVCAFARLGYHYLRIDADGADVEGLPVFDW